MILRIILIIAALIPTQAHADSRDALTVPATQAQITLSFSPVVKKASPAVVNIYTRRTVQVRSQMISPFMMDPMFRPFFGGDMGFGAMPRERVVRSLGSGVIVNADGTVVTSHHVIKDTDEITVVLADKSEYEATVVKVDAQSDLAVLKIPAKDPLPFLALRDSDTLEVGDLVLAIGNPFGIGQTVTQGIVSALARQAQGVSDYQFFIQTDAAINPGNSGGALVDSEGRLVGVNTAIYSTSGGSNGVGFAIPANMVQAVLSGKVSQGNVVHPWFGLNVQPITPEIANSLGMAKPEGVLVQEAYKDGPAQKAGILAGDIIQTVDGKPVHSEQDLNFRAATSRIGQPVAVGVYRAGQVLLLDVVPVAPDAAALMPNMVLLEGKHPLAGLTVADLTPGLAAQMGLATEQRIGVVVVKGRQVKPVGMAMRAGDIILEVNGAPVSSVAQLRRLLADRAAGWKISFRRGNAVMTLAVVS